MRPDERARLVREESDTYLESIAQQQEWKGDEPALQLLLMPSTLSCKLPQYSCEPEFLDPLHCRPCFQYFPRGGEEEHLRESHDPPLTRAEYRRLVLRQTLSEWPQAIPPQVLRSRLAAFKSELCDAHYAEKPRASCCRLKSPSKLFEVSFPSPATDKVTSGTHRCTRY